MGVCGHMTGTSISLVSDEPETAGQAGAVPGTSCCLSAAAVARDHDMIFIAVLLLRRRRDLAGGGLPQRCLAYRLLASAPAGLLRPPGAQFLAKLPGHKRRARARQARRRRRPGRDRARTGQRSGSVATTVEVTFASGVTTKA
jgi:hypothetical protein